MAKQKLDLKKLDMAAETLKAIAHPLRIAIIEMLENKNKMTVTQIYERLKIEQPTASHHLSVLKNKNVLEAQRNGRKIYYSLKYETLSNIIHCINQCNNEAL